MDFYLTVTDDASCVARDTVHFDVSTGLTADAGVDDTICRGIGNNIGGSPTASGGFAPYSYTWEPTANIDDATTANPLATPDAGETYIVTVTDRGGCEATDAVTLNVSDPSADAGSDEMICNGDTTTIGGSPTASGGFGTYTYAWSPATDITGTSVANPQVYPNSDPATYNVTITDEIGCKGIDNIQIRVSIGLSADASQDDTICEGETIVLGGTSPASGGITPYTYSWTPPSTIDDPTEGNPNASPTNNISYALLVTDQANCTDSDTVDIVVYPLPTSDAGPDTTICFGDSAILDGAGSGTVAPYAFSWSPTRGFISPADTSDPLVSPFNGGTDAEDVTYTLNVTDARGCSHSDDMILTLLPAPGTNFVLDSVCRGESIQLEAWGGTSYLWAPAEGLNDPGIPDPLATPDSTTTYIVVVSSDYCGDETASTTVKVNPLPLINAGPDTNIFIGETVQLFAEDGISYSWEPPVDFITADTIATPRVQPLESISYIVTVENKFGCVNTDTVDIQIKDLYDIFVPSAFAPNGNVEANKKLCVKQYGVAAIDFKIYNRWGQLVFETTDLDDPCWNGAYKGELQHMQTFGYILKYELYSGEQKIKKGTITLLK